MYFGKTLMVFWFNEKRKTLLYFTVWQLLPLHLLWRNAAHRTTDNSMIHSESGFIAGFCMYSHVRYYVDLKKSLQVLLCC